MIKYSISDSYIASILLLWDICIPNNVYASNIALTDILSYVVAEASCEQSTSLDSQSYEASCLQPN